MNDAPLTWTAATILASPEARRSPTAALFLLRFYAESGRDDVREAVEHSLGLGLELAPGERDVRRRCEWLLVFAEAAAIADDAGPAEAVQSLLAATIDALEQHVRASYEPGDGLLGATLDDQLLTARALLIAFELTGRLPYSMLAEELLRVAHRRAWEPGVGLRGGFAANCVGVQVLCRLAMLHDDPEYAAHAVVAEVQTYAADAACILTSLAERYRAHPDAADEYGVARLDGFTLRVLPN